MFGLFCLSNLSVRFVPPYTLDLVPFLSFTETGFLLSGEGALFDLPRVRLPYLKSLKVYFMFRFSTRLLLLPSPPHFPHLLFPFSPFVALRFFFTVRYYFRVSVGKFLDPYLFTSTSLFSSLRKSQPFSPGLFIFPPCHLPPCHTPFYTPERVMKLSVYKKMELRIIIFVSSSGFLM